MRGFYLAGGGRPLAVGEVLGADEQWELKY